jgi:hypothetical protein
VGHLLHTLSKQSNSFEEKPVVRIPRVAGRAQEYLPTVAEGKTTVQI